VTRAKVVVTIMQSLVITSWADTVRTYAESPLQGRENAKQEPESSSSIMQKQLRNWLASILVLHNRFRCWMVTHTIPWQKVSASR